MLLPVFFNSSKNTWPFRYCIVVYLYCVDVSTKVLVLIKTKLDLFLHFLLMDKFPYTISSVEVILCVANE